MGKMSVFGTSLLLLRYYTAALLGIHMVIKHR